MMPYLFKSFRSNFLALAWTLALAAVVPARGLGQDAEPVPEPPAEPPKTTFEGNKRDKNARAVEAAEEFNFIRDIVRVGGDAHLKKNERTREMVVVLGDATVDGEVERDLVVVLGNLKLNGSVGGTVSVIMGKVELGKEATVNRDLVAIGGTIDKAPTATVGGETISVPLGPGAKGASWLSDWFKGGVLMGRPLPPGVTWAWAVAGVFLLVYLLAALLMPRPVQSVVDVLDARPVASFFSGVLTMILMSPILFLLAVSVVGIIVIPFALCAAVAGTLVGKAAVLRFAGLQIARQTQSALLQNLLISTIVGGALVLVLYMIPLLGFVAWGILTPLGLGAAVMAAFASMRKEEVPPTTVRIAPAGAGAGTGAATLGVAVAGAAAESGAVPSVSDPLSPETITLARVGFWRRFFATLLDFILLVWLIPLVGPFFLLTWCVYHVVMWGWKGTTVGGIVLGLKVVRADGRPLDFAVALVRSLSSFFSFFVLCLGFFWVGWDREKQSWHDKIAGTTIVRVPKGLTLI